jgi:hypothetical protein
MSLVTAVQENRPAPPGIALQSVRRTGLASGRERASVVIRRSSSGLGSCPVNAALLGRCSSRIWRTCRGGLAAVAGLVVALGVGDLRREDHDGRDRTQSREHRQGARGCAHARPGERRKARDTGQRLVAVVGHPLIVPDGCMERTLTHRELNRAVLARQLLLERAGTPLPRALERVAGIQAQYAPSMYIGLWTRLEGFERDALTRALERRTVVQGTLMRATIHLVSAADWWPLTAGVREARRAWWIRATGRGLTSRQMLAAARKLGARLAGGPMSRKEIQELLGKDAAHDVGMWLAMVRVPPSGTWERRRADLYGSAEEWLGPCEADEAAGIELLVRRYLGGFGPATRKEIANWAGLRVGQIEPALEGMSLRSFRSDDGSELLDLPRAPLPDPETPAPVRYLPTWDTTLLAHARRARIVPEEHRVRIFNTKMPQSAATFMVDGSIAGLWRHDQGRIRLEPFGRLSRAVRAELEEEGERLAAFLA